MPRRRTLALLAAAALACGRAKTDAATSSGAAAGPPPAPPSPEPASAQGAPDPATWPCDGRVAVRLVAKEPKRRHARRPPRNVQLVVGPLEAASPDVGVADPLVGTVHVSADAVRLALLDVPPGSAPFDVHVPITGGHVGAYSLAGATRPIRFRLDPGSVDPARCQADVELDLVPSIRILVTDREIRTAFVPRFKVAY